MDLEHERGTETSEYERDQEAWNLPRPQAHTASTPPDEWPSREQRFRQGLESLQRTPRPASREERTRERPGT